VALGALAVGDDPDPGRGAAQHPDRLGAADRRPGAVLAPAHIDDRDVEIADVADQLQRLLAGDRLVHLEVVSEHPPDSEPDQWVIVDHQAVGALAQD
jgi:hypothetical protein